MTRPTSGVDRSPHAAASRELDDRPGDGPTGRPLLVPNVRRFVRASAPRAWVLLAAAACWSSEAPPSGDAAADAPGSPDGPRTDAPGESLADGDAEEDAASGCRPASWVEAEEIERERGAHAGEMVWIHGYLGVRQGPCEAASCPDDACCNSCEWSAVLRGVRYAAPSAGPGLRLDWTGATPPVACSGNTCHAECHPWGIGTELWVRASIVVGSETRLWVSPLEVCPGAASPPPGTYRITVRAPIDCDWRGRGGRWGLMLVGSPGTLKLWLDGGEAVGELSLAWVWEDYDYAETLRGTLRNTPSRGAFLMLESTRVCEPCSCFFDVLAEFPDGGSIVGRAYRSPDFWSLACECFAAFSFEGSKVSDEVVS